jgi:dsRNA-specific ribonuclease
MPDRSSAPKDARRRLLRALAKELGHEFTDLDHLDRALTHASTGNEGKRNYERLEFLGDAILNFAVADALFQKEPEIPEGQLTETRSHYVSRKPLAAIARKLDLSNHLLVGKGAQEFARTMGFRIEDDLNTAIALTSLETLVGLKKVDVAQQLAAIAEMDAVLGINLMALSRTDLRIRPKTAIITEDEIESALAARKEARAAKDFAKSDIIRDDLIAKGVEVMDGDPLGWDWRLDI